MQGVVASQQSQIASMTAEIVTLTAEVSRHDITIGMMEDLQKETKAKLDYATEVLAKVRKEESSRTLIDVKHKSRPPFDGTKPNEFIHWSPKFQNFATSKFPQADRALDWAKIQSKPIKLEAAEKKISEVGDLEGFNNQLYGALFELLSLEPYSITKNVAGRNGLEVWRKLHHRYDPQIAARVKASMNSIVRTTQVPLNKLGHAIENWEEMPKPHKMTLGSRQSMRTALWMHSWDCAQRH